MTALNSAQCCRSLQADLFGSYTVYDAEEWQRQEEEICGFATTNYPQASACFAETSPDGTPCVFEKKTKKKEKQKDIDTEHMYSLDEVNTQKLDKAKPVKERKEKTEREKIQEAVSAMATIEGAEEGRDTIPTQYPIEEDEAAGKPSKPKHDDQTAEEKDRALLRSPSPNRSRHSSPVKSPKRKSSNKTCMKVSAAKVTPPGISSLTLAELIRRDLESDEYLWA